MMNFRLNIQIARRVMARMVATSENRGPTHVAVIVRGEIGERKAASLANVRRQLAAAPYAASLTLTLDSDGGGVSEAFAMHAAIREHPAERKRAIIAGQCVSAAGIVALACDLRVAKPNAEIMIHRAAFDPGRSRSRWTASRHRQIADLIARADHRIIALLAERTNVSTERFRREMLHGRPMRLIDALACGVIHQIEGQTRAPDPAWAARIASAADAGHVFGMPSHMFTDNYRAACRAARRT